MGISLNRYCVALLAVAAVSCAGNGEGLDQNGNPISSSGGSSGGSSGVVTADLKSIQDNVFTPICSKCHIGASAPEGLQLDAAHAYSFLVDVPSAEEPNLVRVKPGDPDNSYMVRKIEGLPSIVGGQMPLGETPLPQATIDAIRQWITNGAPITPSSAAVEEAKVFAVLGTTPANAAAAPAPLRRIVVAFTQELDETLVNDSTVIVQRIVRPAAGAADRDAAARGDALPETTQQIPVVNVLAEHNPAVLMITPATPLEPGVYRVLLRGSGGGALANLAADTLGVDVSWEFTVTAAAP
jgi:hypothetical protein